LAEQWPQLQAHAQLLGCAPDDEILAEILMLQSELVQQVRRIARIVIRTNIFV
jgi:hypothetical protein